MALENRKSSIRQHLRDARRDLVPYEQVPAGRIRAMGREWGIEAIEEAILWLDHLSREIAALPAWDGDSQDDLSRAQDSLRAILGQVSRAHFATVAGGLDSPEWRTRVNVAMALVTLDPAAALPLVQDAIAREPEGAARQILAQILAGAEGGVV